MMLILEAFPVRARAQIIRLFHLTFVAALLVLFSPASYGQSAAEEIVAFNIPSKAVPLALNDFSRQAGVALAFSESGFDDVQANAVIGRYQRRRALQLLLEGTGLAVKIGANDRVSVRSVSSTTAPTADATAAGNGSVLMAHAGGSGQGAILGVDNSAGAQDPLGSTTNNPLESAPRQVDEILVTGSRIRGAQNASPVLTIGRLEIERAGYATVEDIIEDLPQNYGAGASQDGITNLGLTRDRVVGGDVGDFVGGTSVNLRGLGASSTLVLFNGRRMSPSGRSASFADISGIPVTAIERVEVLTDGASAIYGSDAIGGVVNFIVRDDYEGAETRLQVGADGEASTSVALFGQTLGKTWEDGNILLSYEYFKHEALANSDRDYASTRDLTRFGGEDFRVPGGNPANIRTGPFGAQESWAIPTGQDGTALTPADFDPAAPLNLYNSRAFTDMLPEQERHSAFLSLSQSIGEADVFADVRYSNFENTRRTEPSTASFDVPSTNPFFVDPTGSGLTTVTVLNYSFADDLGPTITAGESDSYNVALGVNFSLGDEWNAEIAGNWAREEATLGLSNFLDTVALGAAVNQTDSSQAFNPFGDGANTNPAVISTLRSPRGEIVESENDLWSVSANIDGSVFSVPGGKALLAAGFEYREEAISVLDGSPETGEPLSPTIDSSRDVSAAYAELFLPLVSSDNGRPGLRRLELSMAVRYEEYSDFDDTTNTKFGLVWAPMESVMLRGTWGTSFRAPQLSDMNVEGAANQFLYLPQLLVDAGQIPFTALVLVGGNESLQPEEATTWTVGLELSPKSIKGLSLDLTYFNVDFEDRIDVPFSSLLDGYQPRFASLLETSPTQEEIFALVNDPRYQEVLFGFLPTPSADILSGAATVDSIMDRRINNLSTSIVTGLEVQLSYAFGSSVGDFALGLNGNYLFDFERALLASDPVVDEVDTLGRPVDLRARANITWNRDAWTISGFINYTDGYTDNISDPERAIDSYTTVDLTFSYDTSEIPTDGWLGNTRFSLTGQNLFDEEPPFVNNFGGVSYDPVNANGLGRFVMFQVNKQW